MGIKCTCEGDIHRFTMYLKRIRKRNTVEQHQVVSLRSQIVILPTTTEFCLKLNLYYLILAPLLEFMEIFYCINHNVR